MRKLNPSEVALLVAGLTIGSGKIEAAEDAQLIATVTVSASRIVTVNTSPAFSFPVGIVNAGQLPASGSQTNDPTQQAYYDHAIKCTMEYGRNRGATPKAGFFTYFDNNYGWTRGFDVYASTAANQPPPGTGWVGAFGFTSHYSPGQPYITGHSQIFLKNNTTVKQLIDTLAHEWAHQWEADGGDPAAKEAAAATVGRNVAQAYQNDQGRLCGGL